MASIVTVSDIDGWNTFSARAQGVSAAATPSVVVNKDALTAQTYYGDPYRLINGDDTSGANVVRLQVPTGATYGFLSMAYVVGTGAHPTRAATVRAHGNLGKYGKGSPVYGPGSLGNGFETPDELWEPLGNDNTGVYELVVGSIGTAIAQVNNGHYQSIPTAFHLHGARELIVAVREAALGPQFAAILASFRR